MAIGTTGTITVTIPANDQPTTPEATAVEFVVTTASINEGDEYEIELRLVDSMGNALSYSQEIVVTLDVVNTIATTLSADEYLLDGEKRFSTMVTIPANEITGTVLFQSVDDNADEPDEYITLRISAVDQVSWQIGRTLRIDVRDDDDPLPTATLSTASLKVEEGQDASFMILLSETATEDLEFELTRREGTATEGEDYSLPALPIVVPAGELGVTVTISTLSDAAYESTTVRFALTPETGTNVILGTPSEILLEIEELFDAVLTFQTDGVEVRDEDIDTSVITEAGTYSETLRVVLRDVSAMREVLQELPDEYQHLEISALADIYFVDDKGDTISDLDRGVTVTISVPMSEVDSLGGPELISFAVLHDGASEWELLATTYKIVDSEYVFETASDRFSLFGLVLRPVVVGFDSRTYRVNEASGTVELTVSVISGVLTETITLNYKTMDGSAIAGEDYTGTIGMITLSLMTPSVTISVDITEDATLESEEEFTVELSGAPVGVSFNPTRATVTIIDKDAVEIGFDRAAYRVSEGSGSLTLTVSVISGVLTETLRLSYVVSDVSTTGSDDYTVTVEMLELSMMTPSVTISVDITDDTSYEPEEEFTVELIGAPVGVSFNPPKATVTIIDDDAVVIGFDRDAYSVAENAGQVILTVSVINGVLLDAITLNFATSDGSAKFGTDYTLTTGTVTLSLMTPSVMFSVDIIDDPTHESAEEFTVELNGASAGITLDPAIATVTIPRMTSPWCHLQ